MKGLLACGVLLGALAGGVLVAAPAEASPGTVVSAGNVLVWSNVFHVLPALPRPAEGQLNGYGFSASVTGDECAASVGSGNIRLSAPAGFEVCVFSLIYEPNYPDLETDTGQPIPGLGGAVDVGARSLSLSKDLDETTGDDFAVAVPSGESATLVLSSAGYSQSFSLTASHPTGTRPAVLYEPAAKRSIASLLGASFRFSETSGDRQAAMRARVSSAELGWFLPGDPLDWPNQPDEAFLAVTFTETQIPGPGGVSFGDFAPLPGSALELSSQGKTQTAISTSPEALGLLNDATYVFTVPIADPGGKLTITPGTQLGYEYARAGASNLPVEVRFSPAAGAARSSARGARNGTARASTSTTTITAIAAGSTGGVVVLVLFVVIPVWRRRKGERILVLFPPPGPLRTDGESPPAAPGGDVKQLDTPPAPAGLEVRLLGPVQAQPLGPSPRRHVLVEACAYLTMNGNREVPSDEFRHALGTRGKDLAPAAFYNVMSELRKALGPDVLVTTGHAGYRFTGDVNCDWVSFKELVASRSQSDDERIAHLNEALALVKGYPFQSPSKDRYQWAYDRNYVEEMVTAIDNAAVGLSNLLLGAGRDAEAYDAAQIGLRAARQSYTLHACRLRAARADRGRLDRAWQDTVEAVGEIEELRALRDALVHVPG
jgi:hypothetical protein